MYLAAGDWGKASAEFRSLVTTSDKEPRYLVAYIVALLQHGETSSAESYLDRLEKLVPKQFLTVSLRADLLLAGKEPRKALALLNEFVDRTDVQPKDRGTRSRLVAEKLVQLLPKFAGQEQKPLAEEFGAQAETLGRAYFKQNPGQDLVLAVFLERSARPTRPWTCSNRPWGRALPKTSPGPAPSFGKAAASSLRSKSSVWTASCERRLRRFDRPVALLLVMAELRSRQARYADAEAFYREVLGKNSSDAVAMNNLAVLLAMQGIKLDEALKLMNRAVEIAGRVGAMLDSRASVYMALNDQENALKDILDALKDGETSVRLFHLAQVYQLSGEEKEARETMDKALKKGLTGDMLQPLELPAFEKLRQLPR